MWPHMHTSSLVRTSAAVNFDVYWIGKEFPVRCTCLNASNRKLFQTERSPAEVSIGRHFPEAPAADVGQHSRDTSRRTSTTESYRARKRQFEKNPGSICRVTSKFSLAIPISFTRLFCFLFFNFRHGVNSECIYSTEYPVSFAASILSVVVHASCSRLSAATGGRGHQVLTVRCSTVVCVTLLEFTIVFHKQETSHFLSKSWVFCSFLARLWFQIQCKNRKKWDKMFTYPVFLLIYL